MERQRAVAIFVVVVVVYLASFPSSTLTSHRIYCPPYTRYERLLPPCQLNPPKPKPIPRSPPPSPLCTPSPPTILYPPPPPPPPTPELPPPPPRRHWPPPRCPPDNYDCRCHHYHERCRPCGYDVDDYDYCPPMNITN
ncbi:extensin-like [Durio zibethinus]|uniref:Extensin-like n=1 Tax=Durio zibethinus TaxID=66656 RepID=A0A6P5YJA5_DURZI|nr:extensin-like [Durio zibethinus]